MPDSNLDVIESQAEAGDVASREKLFHALYAELHRMAERELRRLGPGASISPTTVLHETYLSVSGRSIVFADHGRFMAYAARAMRGLIIDYIRSRHAVKRGRDFHITHLTSDSAEAPADDTDLQELGDAMEQLNELDPRLARVVDLRFFCGLSFAEIAALQEVSERTVQRDWDKARLLLHGFLES